MSEKENEKTPYPQALSRIEQALARIQVASDLAAQKIEIAAKAAAEDAVESAKQIAVLIERVSSHIGRVDLHGDSTLVKEMQADVRAQRKWLVGALISFALALVALVWKVIWDHVSKGAS